MGAPQQIAAGALRHPALALLAALVALTLWRVAALALQAPPLQFDEAQYWYWAQQLDWGYYSKPPLIAWGIAASTALFGDGMLAVRLPTLLCFPLAAGLVFCIARRLFPDADQRTALIAALGFATLPTVSFYSWAATTDGWLILCWALGTFALVRALSEDRWRDWLLLGAAVGVGLLAKYAMAVFAASAAAYLLWHARSQLRSARPWAAVALASFIVLPNALWNAQHDFETLRHTADISHLDGNLVHPGSLISFIASQFAVFGPIPMSVLIVMLIDRFRQRSPAAGSTTPPRHDPVTLLLWLGLPMLALIVVQAFLARAFANWAQAAYVPLAIAVFAWLVARERWTLLKWSFALHLAFAVVLYHHGTAFRALGFEPPRAFDLTARLRPWPEAGRQVVALLEARPGAALLSDEREVLAELAYYARSATPEIVAFNPDHAITDHFRLTRDLAASRAERFVVISRHLGQGDLAPYFSRVVALAPVTVAVRSDSTVVLHAFEAEGFHGY